MAGGSQIEPQQLSLLTFDPNNKQPRLGVHPEKSTERRALIQRENRLPSQCLVSIRARVVGVFPRADPAHCRDIGRSSPRHLASWMRPVFLHG